MNPSAATRAGAEAAPLAPWIVLLGIILATVVIAGNWRAKNPVLSGTGATLELAELLSADPAGFAVADRVRTFQFPEDHGPHPGFRSEWWYFTGNLESDAGRRFGFQLTFFRFALGAGPEKLVEQRSRWAARQVYMAHFAVSDGAGRRFRAYESFEREALGLAGARADPFRVWLGPWEARATGPGFFPLRLRARRQDAAIDLVVGAGKPVVLQGDRGLSQKSARPGNASYYYSYTRLPAHGRVRIDGETHAVRGNAWMDREWSTSALAPEQAGWDWFALQLDDGRDIMFYRLRNKDGDTDPHSAGSLVDAQGNARYLGAGDVMLKATRQWRSPLGGSYPVGWRMRIPGHAIDLRVSPLFPGQEHASGLRYWEGAVDVAGTSAGRAVGGHGYLELTGYATSRR